MHHYLQNPFWRLLTGSSKVMSTQKPPSKRPSVTILAAAFTGWDWDYTIGFNKRDEIVREYRHLNINSEIIRPEKLMGRAFQISLLPKSSIGGETLDPKMTSVGHIFGRKGTLEALLSTTNAGVEQCALMLSLNRFRFCEMDISPLRFRQADVFSYSMSGTLSDEEE